MTRKTPLYREIWLEPVCADCWTPSSEICWCDDNVFEPCPNCDMKPTRYVIDQRQLLKRKTATGSGRHAVARPWRASHPQCQAMQHSDQMVCEPCNLSWDMNDPAPPRCRA